MADFFKKLFKKDKDTKKDGINEAEVEISEDEEYLSDEEIEKMIIEDMGEAEEESAKNDEELNGDNSAEISDAKNNASFFKKLKDGLFKTRKNITDRLNSVVNSFKTIDEDLFDELEEILITSDVGVETTMKLLDGIRKKVKEEKVNDPKAVIELLKQEVLKLMSENAQLLSAEYPQIIVVIGVNGVGKTTSVGKIANRYKKAGKKVLIAAADTFRAAAIEQLEVWSNRVGVDIIKHQEGADPAAIIYDAISAAKSRKTDVIICDTAGRLHNKKNLMEELKKIFRIIDREYPEAHREVYLVLDATTGQNAIVQAKVFKEAADITGIVLTKLDGTAKGGIVIAIKSELNIPVRLVGVGEKIDDLQDFDPVDFANALFSE
ncbi:signal recognition particle-docking protein FtsY [Lutispora saccharofermentans]|uniref:Signal recognition particle receptor FtsY n=1 Tax=Lutispora saccharofermentans TaxID=3024236 RepID=A0ABT1N9V8_9FIRM|nr:signal recognition particle-docking protein FtsY [Lutispora saccharofermentans]MCQ1528028.1 signal recognition particle-docking protein FtsY [Lutispora saccharofermentans]